MLLSRLFPKFHKIDQYYLFSTKILYFALGGLYHTFYVYRLNFYIDYLKVNSLNASFLQIILNIASFAGVNIWSNIADNYGVHRILLICLCLLSAISFNSIWILNYFFGDSYNFLIGCVCLLFFGLFIGGVMPLTDYHILRRLEEVPHVDSRLYARQVMFGTMSYGALSFILGFLFDLKFSKSIFFLIIPVVAINSAITVYFMGCPDSDVVIEKEKEPPIEVDMIEDVVDEISNLTEKPETKLCSSPSYLNVLSMTGLDTRGTVVHYYHHHKLDYNAEHPNPVFAEDCCPFNDSFSESEDEDNDDDDDDTLEKDDSSTTNILFQGEENEKMRKEKYQRLWKGISEHKAKIIYVLSCAFTTGIGRQLLQFFLSTHLDKNLGIKEGTGNIYLFNCLSSVFLFWTGPIFLRKIGKRIMLLLGILAMVIRLSMYAFILDKNSSHLHVKVVFTELFNGLSFVLTHLAGVKEAGDCAPIDWEATFQSTFQCIYVQLPAVLTSLGGAILSKDGDSLHPIRITALFSMTSLFILSFFAVYLNILDKRNNK